MIKNCKDIEASILKDVKEYVKICSAYDLAIPKLFMLQIGKDDASSNYVARKEMKCKETGVLTETIQISRCTNYAPDLLNIIDSRNEDHETHGIMIQQPTPFSDTENEELLQRVAPIKDVDGFTNENCGALANNTATLKPCTAKGVIDILKHNEIDVMGKLVLVIGKGRTSGRPIAQMLQNLGATVFSANSKTPCLNELIATADIVISCTGKPHIIKGYWIEEPNEAIINVGMCWEEGKLKGDVDVSTFEAPMWEDTLVTTVSGSTGLLTVAHLLMNTCISHYLMNEGYFYPSEKEHLVPIIKKYTK